MNGVTQFLGIGSAQTATYCTVEQWEREHAIFHSIISIPFFRKFRIWKSFKIWKKARWERKLNNCTEALNSLSILNPLLRPTLLAVRGMCCDLITDENTRLYKVDTFKGTSLVKKTYSLDEFTANQADQARKMRHELSRFAENISQQINRACDGNLTKFKEGFTTSRGSAGSESKDSMTFTKMAALRVQCSLLTKYIRVADFMVVGTLMELLVVSVSSVLEFVRPTTVPAKNIQEGDDNNLTLGFDVEDAAHFVPLFTTIVEHKTHSEVVNLSPSDEQFYHHIDVAIDQFINVVLEPVRMVSQPLFMAYVQPTFAQDKMTPTLNCEATDFNRMIDEEKSLLELREQITEGLKSAFAQVNQYAKDFDVYCKIYIEDEGALAHLRTTFTLETKLDDFRCALDKYSKQIALFDEGIKSVHDVCAAFSPDHAKSYVTVHQLQNQAPDSPLPAPIKVEMVSVDSGESCVTPWAGGSVVWETPCTDTAGMLIMKNPKRSATEGKSGDNPTREPVSAHISAVQVLLNQAWHDGTADFTAGDGTGTSGFFAAEVKVTVSGTDASEPYTISVPRHDLRLVLQVESVTEGLHEPVLLENGWEFQNPGPISIVRVDSQQFRDTFLPMPQHCKGAVEQLLPELFGTRTNILFDDVQACVSELNKNNDTVEKFVAHSHFLKSTMARMTEIQTAMDLVADTKEVLDEYGVEIDDELRVQFVSLAGQHEELKANLALCENNLDEGNKAWAKRVDDDIPEVKKNCVELRKTMQDEMFMRKYIDLEDMIVRLEGIQGQFNSWNARAKQLSEYQEVLKVQPEDFEDLSEATLDFNLKRDVWYSVRDWAVKVSEWMAADFANLDMAEMEKTIGRFMKTVVKAEKTFEGMKVVPVLKAEVQDIKHLGPVIQGLRNPRLLPHHWDKIDAAVGKELPKEGLTLGLLLEMKVNEYSDQIAEISIEATQEGNLSDMLARIMQSWEGVDLFINPYKDFKEVYIIGSLEDINTLLDDSLVNVATIMSSRFVGAIRVQVESLNEKLLTIQDTLVSV
jgi:hypothetical protein